MLIYFADGSRFYKSILLTQPKKKTDTQEKEGVLILPSCSPQMALLSIHIHLGRTTKLDNLWSGVPLVRNISCKMSLMHVSSLSKAVSLNNMGNMLKEMRLQRSLYYYSIVIKINPAHVDEHNCLALICQVFISHLF